MINKELEKALLFSALTVGQIGRFVLHHLNNKPEYEMKAAQITYYGENAPVEELQQ